MLCDFLHADITLLKGGWGGGGGGVILSENYFRNVFILTTTSCLPVASKVGTSQLLAISSLALLACSIAHCDGSVGPTSGVVVCEGERWVPQGSSHWEEELR